MACANCTESSIYDMACQPCRVRLVKSCRSTKTPRIARQQQEGMLACIERMAGPAAREATINELKGERE